MEKDIEGPFMLWVEDVYGFMPLKLNVSGQRGWPDVLVIGSLGRKWMIEFKDKGKKPRKLQRYIHCRIKEFDHDVQVFDNLEDAKTWFEKEVRTTGLPAGGYEVSGC